MEGDLRNKIKSKNQNIGKAGNRGKGANERFRHVQAISYKHKGKHAEIKNKKLIGIKSFPKMLQNVAF